jgi:3-oxoacyl-[acyl-carrier-protein] synthase-3
MTQEAQRAGILGTGKYVPERVITNEWFTTFLDTSDEWIFERTGIKERRYAREDEYTSDMAAAAARAAVKNAGLELKDIDYILIGTATPDNQFPSTACRVGHMLGIDGVGAIDVSTACSGFVYGLELATALVNSGLYKNVLAIGAEKLSAISDFSDRTTCVLFGDGAGAAVVGRGGHEILNTRCSTAFNYEALHLKAGGSRCPAGPKTYENKEHYIRMNGREVYRFVVSSCVEMMNEAIARAGIKPSDIALFVPHQANANMLEFAAEKAGIPADRIFLNIQKYGNSSSASIPMALTEAIEEGRVKKGDLVLLLGFGGGLSSGYALIRW